MKDWVMIHKIKALYDEGRGSSLHAIAKALGISRNTVPVGVKAVVAWVMPSLLRSDAPL